MMKGNPNKVAQKLKERLLSTVQKSSLIEI
jgi:hypothetical protein